MADKKKKVFRGSDKKEEQQEPEVKEEKVPETEEAAKPEENTEKKAEAESKAEEKTEQKAEEKTDVKSEEKPEEKAETKPAQDTAAAESDRYLRLLAEFNNYKRRTQKEKESIYSDAKIDAVSAFLPVYDNLERALAQSTQDEAYRKGVEMTMDQLKEIFKKFGVEEIDCLGKTFDPTCQNAVMHIEDETKGENEVVDVFQKGFKLGDKIIRLAMVRVAN